MFKALGENNPEKGSGSKFMERFEGRTSTIGKAGLLSLLEQNRPGNSPPLEGGYSIPLLYDSPPSTKKIEQNSRMAMGSRYSNADNSQRASHLSFRSDLPRKNSLEQTKA